MFELGALKNARSELDREKKPLVFNYTVLPPSISSQVCMHVCGSTTASLRLSLIFIFLLNLVRSFKSINVCAGKRHFLHGKPQILTWKAFQLRQMETGVVKAFLLNRFSITANINGSQVCFGRCHVYKCYYFHSSQNKMLHFQLVMSFQNKTENGKWRHLLKFSLHISKRSDDNQGHSTQDMTDSLCGNK